MERMLYRVINTRQCGTEILELRYQGTPVAEIARHYGISVARVSKVYYRALAPLAEPIAELERKRALEVADQALVRFWTIEQADTDPKLRIKAPLSVLKWEEYRSHLLGLDDLPPPTVAAVDIERRADREKQLRLVRDMPREERQTIREIHQRSRSASP